MGKYRRGKNVFYTTEMLLLKTKLNKKCSSNYQNATINFPFPVSQKLPLQTPTCTLAGGL